ncbi:hypothetical protein EV424DRAFT_1351520 [Suillus variegatus]|nr:hypothetical protein EV424DRAFT_1351520 [Suillus variegatus]
MLREEIVSLGTNSTSRVEGVANTENSWWRYTFAALSKLAKRVDHPSGQVGVLLLCPEEGAIIGPISSGSTEKHACFADRIYYFLEKEADLSDIVDATPVSKIKGAPRIPPGSFDGALRYANTLAPDEVQILSKDSKFRCPDGTESNVVLGNVLASMTLGARRLSLLMG